VLGCLDIDEVIKLQKEILAELRKKNKD